jgi:hypothetical protein
MSTLACPPPLPSSLPFFLASSSTPSTSSSSCAATCCICTLCSATRVSFSPAPAPEVQFGVPAADVDGATAVVAEAEGDLDPAAAAAAAAADDDDTDGAVVAAAAAP